MKKIGIIYSPCYGAGWSTWGCAEMALDQELAVAIDLGNSEKVAEIAEKNWPDAYKGGLDDCVVEWVDEGTAFEIEEYDGYESIKWGACHSWLIAK